MDEKEKARLKALPQKPKKRCEVCHSWQSYKNPICKCFECKKNFCYDHINSIQMNNKMKKEDELRDICDECQKKHGYRTV